MPDKDKKELLETITKIDDVDKAFVTGYAAGVVAKTEKAKDEKPKEEQPKPA